MRPLRGHANASELEFDPIALFEMMNAPIERQQELEAMVRRASSHIM